ncbi:hypothetical protein [Sphingomonas sp. PAMC 26621]|uniref:hypothetical protein n=1 Tax=Sphingomonas sp. PAMC 26621 TaxID=1112213 RepID=UPI0002881D8E|nr:hypothetical protein [Sphingomonas sp. PAMC 26621]
MTDRPIIVSAPTVRAGAAARQLHILQHALGVDQYGQGDQYRSHFVTGAGSDDHPHCIALFEAGLMKRRANVEMYGGMDAFFVTDEGREFVAANSPPPPKLTRSQRRYQAWLDADCNLSFIDYCRRAGAGASV